LARSWTSPTESERKKSFAKIQHELARVSRVTTLGELTASIAHEVNAPLGAIATNGYACLRLLARDEPDLNEARDGIESMIRESLRASEVIKRIRALVRKSSPGRSSLNINDTIREVIVFVAAEIERNQIKLRPELANRLPLVIGNRVELQQVVLNLILNSSEAMTAPGWQPRDLLISSKEIESGEVAVAVSDTGVGLESESALIASSILSSPVRKVD
jgi:C4-dicarboxylate-specific signal transduction histidine kinase